MKERRNDRRRGKPRVWTRVSYNCERKRGDSEEAEACGEICKPANELSPSSMIFTNKWMETCLEKARVTKLQFLQGFANQKEAERPKQPKQQQNKQQPYRLQRVQQHEDLPKREKQKLSAPNRHSRKQQPQQQSQQHKGKRKRGHKNKKKQHQHPIKQAKNHVNQHQHQNPYLQTSVEQEKELSPRNKRQRTESTSTHTTATKPTPGMLAKKAQRDATRKEDAKMELDFCHNRNLANSVEPCRVMQRQSLSTGSLGSGASPQCKSDQGRPGMAKNPKSFNKNFQKIRNAQTWEAIQKEKRDRKKVSFENKQAPDRRSQAKKSQKFSPSSGTPPTSLNSFVPPHFADDHPSTPAIPQISAKYAHHHIDEEDHTVPSLGASTITSEDQSLIKIADAGVTITGSAPICVTTPTPQANSLENMGPTAETVVMEQSTSAGMPPPGSKALKPDTSSNKVDTITHACDHQQTDEEGYTSNSSATSDSDIIDLCGDSDDDKNDGRTSSHLEVPHDIRVKRQQGRNAGCEWEISHPKKALKGPCGRTINKKELGEINRAWDPDGDPDEILASNGRINITREDLWTLYDGEWLNDQVINFFLGIVQEDARKGISWIRPNLQTSMASSSISQTGKKKKKFLKLDKKMRRRLAQTFTMNTYFYTKLCGNSSSKNKYSGYEYENVRRWIKRSKLDIMKMKRIIVPVHDHLHWALAIINIRAKSITSFDSLPSRHSKKRLRPLAQWIKDELKENDVDQVENTDFKVIRSKNAPLQNNSSDCGALVCANAVTVGYGTDLVYKARHMMFFRRIMVLTILNYHKQNST